MQPLLTLLFQQTDWFWTGLDAVFHGLSTFQNDWSLRRELSIDVVLHDVDDPHDYGILGRWSRCLIVVFFIHSGILPPSSQFGAQFPQRGSAFLLRSDQTNRTGLHGSPHFQHLSIATILLRGLLPGHSPDDGTWKRIWHKNHEVWKMQLPFLTFWVNTYADKPLAFYLGQQKKDLADLSLLPFRPRPRKLQHYYEDTPSVFSRPSTKAA